MSVKSFREHLNESQLLLEYNADKTWEAHGKKASAYASHLYNVNGDDHHVLYRCHADMLGNHFQSEQEIADAHREHLLPHLEETDPTPNKKYVQHVMRIFGASDRFGFTGGVNRFEDLHSRMRPALRKFDDLVKRKIIPAEHRDIGKIKSLGQLEDLVDAYSEKKSGREQSAEYHEEMKKQATITEHPDFTHIIPHTAEAARHFGQGTKWCTATDNIEDSMFDHYNERGPLHIYIPKKPAYKGEKYQYHYSDRQRMDEKDKHVALKKRQPAIHDHMEDYAGDVELARNRANIKDFEHPESVVKAAVFRRSPDITDEHIRKAVRNVTAYTDTSADENSPWTHPKTQPYHLDELLDEPHHGPKELESINDALFFKGRQHQIHDSEPIIAPQSSDSFIKPHHIDKIIGIANKLDGYQHTIDQALNADATNEHHITKALMSDNPNVVSAAAYSHAFRNDLHFDALYKNKHAGRAASNYITRQFDNHRKGRVEPGYGYHQQIEKLMVHPDDDVKYTVATHYASSQHARERIFNAHPHLKDKYEKEQARRRTAWNYGVNEGRTIEEINEQLLLEYDAEKTWKNHGEKALKAALFSHKEHGDRHHVLDFVVKNHKEGHHSVAGEILQHHFEDTDPTPNKKYVQHVARIYGAGGVNRFEDLHSRMKPALESFHDLVNRKVIPAEHRDIGKIKSLGHLEDLVSEHSDNQSNRASDAAHHEKMKQESTITREKDLTHIIPHTQAASTHFGRGTKWCTTSEIMGMHDSYSAVGPLHILIPHEPTYPGEKYQYHHSTGQFMNEKDDSVWMGGAHPAANRWVSDYKKSIRDAKNDIELALNHPEPSAAESAFKSAPNVTSDHIRRGIEKGGGSLTAALQHPNSTQDHVDHAFSYHNDEENLVRAVDNSFHIFVRSEHLDKAIDHGVIAAVDHPNAEQKHIDKAFDLYGNDRYRIHSLVTLTPSHMMTKEHIDHVIKNAPSYTVSKMLDSGVDFNKEHIDLALQNKDSSVRQMALSRGGANVDHNHLMNAVKSDSGTAMAALNNESINRYHIKQALKHRDAAVKIKALSHPLTTERDAEEFINSPKPRDRAIAARVMANSKHISSAQKDEHHLVRWAAAHNPAATSKQLSVAANDPHPEVRLAAAHHENTSKKDIAKLVNDEDARVRVTARAHKHSTVKDVLPEPKYPAVKSNKRYDNEEEGYKSSFSHTAIPGNEISAARTEALKTYVANHNATSPNKIRIHKYGRYGKGHPDWQADKRKNQRLPIEKASRVDVYASELPNKNVNYQEREFMKNVVKPRHPVFEWHEFGVTESHFLNELSEPTLRSYVRKGRESVEKLESTPASDKDFTKKDNKAFKRRMFTTFAQHRLKEEQEQIDELSHDTLSNYIIKAGIDKRYQRRDTLHHATIARDVRHHRQKVEKRAALTTNPDRKEGMGRAIAQYKDSEKAHSKLKDRHIHKELRREQGLERAKNKLTKKFIHVMYSDANEETELSNVVDNSGSEIINERNLLDPVKYVTVKDRATKSPDVRTKHTQREKSMYNTIKTKDVVNFGFKRAGDKQSELRDKEGHSLTNRWNDERKRRLARLRGKEIKEGEEYVEAQRTLHLAHHESSRRLAGMERDPELRRMDLHRAKKHLHAANVLDILKAKLKKK